MSYFFLVGRTLRSESGTMVVVSQLCSIRSTTCMSLPWSLVIYSHLVTTMIQKRKLQVWFHQRKKFPSYATYISWFYLLCVLVYTALFLLTVVEPIFYIEIVWIYSWSQPVLGNKRKVTFLRTQQDSNLRLTGNTLITSQKHWATLSLYLLFVDKPKKCEWFCV